MSAKTHRRILEALKKHGPMTITEIKRAAGWSLFSDLTHMATENAVRMLARAGIVEVRVHLLEGEKHADKNN